MKNYSFIKNPEKFGLLYAEIMRSDLNAGAKVLFACLAMYYNETAGRLWVSDEIISQEINISTRQVKRYLKELEENNIIRRHTTWNGDKWKRDIYILPNTEWFKNQG